MQSTDLLHRFIFTGSLGDERLAPVRGELVQLDATWQALLSRSDYPPAVSTLLGEAAVAAVLLAATLKIDGKLTLQIMGDKPAENSVSEAQNDATLAVHLLVMQVTSKRELRGLARWHGDADDTSTSGLALIASGRLVLTIETARGERYQGVVSLEGENLAQALQSYFERSEQLPTRLWLEANSQHAAGLLVQKMPGNTVHEADEDWQRIVALSATVTRDELLALPAETLLHRLFHEEDRRMYTPEAVHFVCSCSRERVAEMLRGLGASEVDSIITEQGQVAVDCEFCNARYVFDAVDAAALFAELPHSSAQGLH